MNGAMPFCSFSSERPYSAYICVRISTRRFGSLVASNWPISESSSESAGLPAGLFFQSTSTFLAVLVLGDLPEVCVVEVGVFDEDVVVFDANGPVEEVVALAKGGRPAWYR